MQHLANITREGFAASMEIRPLLDQAGAISDLAEIFFKEWNRYDRRNRAEIEMQLRQNLNHDSLPITFVASRGSELLGTVSVDLSDLPSHDHLSPWLASLYVWPVFCGRGIGSALIAHAVSFCRAKKVPRIFLWTPGSTRLYERCGWRSLESAVHGGDSITIMYCDTI